MKHMIIPIFIPHQGCPFDCIFCNQKSITGQFEEINAESIDRTIKGLLSTSDIFERIEIAFFGGSFTGLPVDKQEYFLDIAGKYIASGEVDGIRISTRPDYIDFSTVKRLIYKNVKVIELGVQSMDEEVLKYSLRGYGKQAVYKAVKIIKQFDVSLGLQTMIGLPGDTLDKALSTAKEIVSLAPDMVRIYPLLVIKGTHLEKMYLSGDYIPLTVDKTVEWCSQLVDIYESAGIKVIRVGLQTTDEINPGADVVAGPFHPAIRQLVESRRLRDLAERQLKGLLSEEDTHIKIFCNPKDESNLIGQKRENIKYFERRFPNLKIEVLTADVPKGSVKVSN